MMKGHPGRMPDWKLERLALGELPPEELEQARAALAREADGQARVEALQASDRALLEAWPPDRVAAEVARRAAATAPERLWDRVRRSYAGWAVAVPTALAAVLVARLVLAPAGPDVDPATGGRGSVAEDGSLEVTRDKGLLPQLRIYRLRSGVIELLRARDEARPAELLQLGYVAAGRPYGVLLSIDGAGGVTLHHPEAADDASRLAPAGEVRLPHSFELDDAPGFERFFLITSRRPFPVRAALEAGRDLAHRPDAAQNANLVLPEGLEQTSVLLKKVTP